MVGRQADLVVLSAEDRTFLEGQVRRHKVPRSLSDRCRMVLLCSEGLQSKEVAVRLGVHEHTVGKWRRRFAADGIEGLTDEYRAGRPRTVSDAQVAEGDCQEFRVWAGIMGKKESHYVPTQRTCDTE